MSEPLLTSAVRAHQAGDVVRATQLYGEILRLDPRQFVALYGLGVLNYQSGRFGDAERLMAEAIRTNPSVADSFFIRGCALQRLNRPVEALACFDRVLALRPDSADALSNRGVTLMALNRNAEALECFERALSLDDSNSATWNNRGCVLVNLGRNRDAIPYFDNALVREPRFTQALINRGSAQAALKQYAAAIADFERALDIEPDSPYAAGNLALYRMQCSDWRHLAADRARIETGVRAGKRIVLPFIHLALSESLADQLRCASIWTTNDVSQPPPLWRGEIYRHERTRVAYVSADFHSHATAALMVGVFERHDRREFEPVAISIGPDDNTPMRARMTAAFEHFIDARDKSDSEIATLMRRMEIDIAVDLKGYTKDNRAGIFAHRPCPIQIAYLGYPGTMGAPFVDFLIADRVVVPESQREFYRERVVWLPDSYQCNSPRNSADDAGNRADWGLPEQGFVFCCFNNAFKINPEIFTIWMRLLRAVRGSVLWLLEDNPESPDNLRREAEARGIAAGRMVFARRVSLEQHLARHRHADLFLDTQPYGAHTTASDALWAGVPVVTVAGPTFAARVAASLLHAVGLTELIATDLAAYEALALRLAWEPGTLADIRTKLASARDEAPLFDTNRFTRHLESAFRIMLERSRRGEPPQSFAVEPDSRPPAPSPAAIPDSAASAFLRGCELVRENNLLSALSRFDEALSLAPEFVEALTNRGGVLLALNRPEDAIVSLDHAVSVDPMVAEAWNNRGNALSRLGRYEEAVASFDRVLALRPHFSEPLINRGTALLASRRPSEALANYEAVLTTNPENPAALQGRANALFELRRFDEAASGFEAVAAAEPETGVAGMLAFTRLQCCEWRMLDRDRLTLTGTNISQQRPVDPFQYLAISSSPEDQRRCAEIWTAAKHPPLLSRLWNGERYQHERIRVAWLSADFRHHPVTQTLSGVWQRLDRARFESLGIGWGAPDDSGARARIVGNFDEYITVETWSDRKVAQLLKEREIDIAIDLMGFTAECRPGIFAARPCPAQVSFLGFAGTMGAPYIDFLIADPIAIPDSERGNFSETIVHLPGSFFPLDKSRAIAPTPSRAEAGLPDKGFVFACFNNSYKLTPELFEIWMRLLRDVGDSVLWLSAANPAASANLQREAQARGVEPDRLVFAPFVDDADRHLARLTLADLFLDTLPYNAHATAADALLAGVPVLTCRGNTFAGRVAASLLHAAELPELVTGDLASYEECALRLALDPERVRALKLKLALGRKTLPLFDTAVYATRLESALASLRDSTASRSFLSTA